jgi:exopolysaccharide biosynthesis polyprenyl glycosylphosphotransferase
LYGGFDHHVCGEHQERPLSALDSPASVEAAPPKPVPAETLLDERTQSILKRQRLAGSSRGRGWVVRRALLTADVVGLGVAFIAVQLLFGIGAGGANLFNLRTATLVYLLSLPGWLVVAKILELYDHDEERTGHTTVDDLARVLQLVTLGAWTFFAGTQLVRAPTPNYPKLVAFWALAIVLITAARAVARSLCRRSALYTQRTVVVGAGEIGQHVARKFLQHPEYGIELVGFVDADPRPRAEDLEGVPVLGTPECLPELVRELDFHRVVIAFSSESHGEMLQLIRALKRLDVQIDLVPRFYEAVGPNVGMHKLESLPLIGMPAAKLFPFSRTIKRLVDVVGASIGLLLSAPLFAFIAWRIRRDSPGPIFFRQTRLGKNMREFTALKFRTMTVGTDDSVHRAYIAQTMDPRSAPGSNGRYKLDRDDITPFGRFLRESSLDELPQLINILRGDMSLVGPRPCIPYETERFDEHHFERFLVPAGLTGLWQVAARAHSSFGEALEMDVAYARNWSLGLDLWLLLRTPFEVLRRTATT